MGFGEAPRVSDLVFSINSIVTAIGMVEHVGVMIAAVVIAVAVMYVASGPVGGFIQRHPTTRMLALSFLLMIGVALVADGIGFHIPRGYIYAAMGFSALVELLNVLARKALGWSGLCLFCCRSSGLIDRLRFNLLRSLAL